MSFVALPSVPSSAQPPAAEAIVYNDGFFPDIDPAAVREAARIPSNITAARLRAAIIGAIMTAAYDLTGFVSTAAAAGHHTLADLPAPELDRQSVQVLRYQRAVALLTKAELIERHADYDTTAAGGDADDLTPTVDQLRRDAQHALRDMQGRARTMVDLI
jgi:hypothetical protein